MARLSRFVLPGHPQHLIVRGNNRDPIFNADEDYHFYLDKLHDAAKKYQCDIHAYVLMTNHVHLLVTPHTEQGISKMIQMLSLLCPVLHLHLLPQRYAEGRALRKGRGQVLH